MRKRAVKTLDPDATFFALAGSVKSIRPYNKKAMRKLFIQHIIEHQKRVLNQRYSLPIRVNC